MSENIFKAKRLGRKRKIKYLLNVEENQSDNTTESALNQIQFNNQYLKENPRLNKKQRLENLICKIKDKKNTELTASLPEKFSRILIDFDLNRIKEDHERKSELKKQKRTERKIKYLLEKVCNVQSDVNDSKFKSNKSSQI